VNTRCLRFRLTAWYAGLLAGALLVFGVSIYLSLERYLISELQRTLIERSRSMGLQLFSGYSTKGAGWLSREVTEAYAPEVNGYFLRISRADGSAVYVSGVPKDNSLDPSRIPLPVVGRQREYSRRVDTPDGYQLVIGGLSWLTRMGRSIGSRVACLIGELKMCCMDCRRRWLFTCP